jgi:hypothetical protein
VEGGQGEAPERQQNQLREFGGRHSLFDLEPPVNHSAALARSGQRRVQVNSCPTAPLTYPCDALFEAVVFGRRLRRMTSWRGRKRLHLTDLILRIIVLTNEKMF